MLLSFWFFSGWLAAGIVWFLIAAVLLHIARALAAWAGSEGVLIFTPANQPMPMRVFNETARRIPKSDFFQVEACRWFWGGPVLFYIVWGRNEQGRVPFVQRWLMLPKNLHLLVRHSLDAAAYSGHYLNAVFVFGGVVASFQPPWVNPLAKCNQRGFNVALQQNFIEFGPIQGITIKDLLALEYKLHDGDSEKIPVRQMQGLRLFTADSGQPVLLRIDPDKKSPLVG